MARFHRDRDLEQFDGSNDTTTANRASLSPTEKASKNTPSDEAAALESLRKRMAGPSSAKAGLSTDQDEINRKIYEASKGSKFFENEKMRDEKTTQQIEKMLRKRTRCWGKLAKAHVGDARLTASSSSLSCQAIQLEATRDFSRVILHADMDMFYAACRTQRDPSLLGKAFGVGSGVLVTASYEARKFGVRSGMAQHIALALCPPSHHCQKRHGLVRRCVEVCDGDHGRLRSDARSNEPGRSLP
ncbi:hypothetical protein L7F22_061667 [Adiantum nelumboides]|nr:hypothetical protein [Adiantum nelumboides]